MKFTFYGQACFVVEVEGKKLLFDPFITGNPLAKDVDISKIEADYIFVSHGHSDHTADLEKLAKQTDAMCIASPEVSKWMTGKGIKQIHAMNQGGPITFDFGKVRGVSAVHSSSMPDGTYAGNPIGFVFTTLSGNFYYAGDTALTMDMQLIPQWAKLDFAILPIGGNFTMDADDAITAAEFIKTDVVIGVHYNTFPVIKIDTEKAVKDFAAAEKKLLLPNIGETIEL